MNEKLVQSDLKDECEHWGKGDHNQNILYEENPFLIKEKMGKIKAKPRNYPCRHSDVG